MTLLLLMAVAVSWYSFWYALSYYLRTTNPIVVVGTDPGLPLNECSMTPNLSPGDLLVVEGAEDGGLHAGDVIVFRNPRSRDEFVVHRVIEVVQVNGESRYRTKGDNDRTNPFPDPWLLQHEDVVGRVIYRAPSVGWVWLAAKNPIGVTVLVAAIIYLLATGFTEPEEEAARERNPL